MSSVVSSVEVLLCHGSEEEAGVVVQGLRHGRTCRRTGGQATGGHSICGFVCRTLLMSTTSLAGAGRGKLL